MSLQASDRARNPSQNLRRYGPWALVTGASDGIGRAIAEQLAHDGFNLVLVARRQDALDALAAELGRTGVETRVVASDLGPAAGLRSSTRRRRSWTSVWWSRPRGSAPRARCSTPRSRPSST